MFNLINKKNCWKTVLILLIWGMLFSYTQKTFASMREDYPRYRVKASTNNVANMLSSRTKAIKSYESSKYDISVNKFSTDLFWDNASKYRVKDQSKAMYWLETIKWILKSQYSSCNLTDKEILWVLFYSNWTWVYFKDELVKTVPVSQWPTQDDKGKACRKLTICLLWEDKKLSNQSCEDKIMTMYDEWVKTKQKLYTLEETNLWSEKFYNWTLEDSSYDIFYDMGQIAKIFYVDAPWTTESSVIFYKMPNFKNWWGSSNWWNNNWWNKWNSSNNWWNGNGWGSKWWNGNGWNNWWWNGNWWNNNWWNKWNSSHDWWNGNEWGSKWWNTIPNVTDDPEINNFINDGVEDHRTVTENWNTAYVNKCVVAWSPKLEEAYLAAEEEEENWEIPSVFDDFTDEEIQELIDDILENSKRLEQTWDKPLPEENQKEWDDVPWALWASTDAAAIEDLRKQLDSCVQKCEWLRFDEKAICKAKCLCSEYSSKALPEDTEFQFLQEWALRIRICNIPSKAVVVSTSTKTVLSIETILSEIHDTIKAMFDSWELTPKMKKQELLDTSMNNIKFSDIVSFNIWMQFKKPTPERGVKEDELVEVQSNLEKGIVNIDQNSFNVMQESQESNTTMSKTANIPEPSKITEETKSLILENKLWWINNVFDRFIETHLEFLRNLITVVQEMTNATDWRLWAG